MSILTVFSVTAEGTQPGSQLDAKIRQFEHRKEQLTKKLEDLSKTDSQEKQIEGIKQKLADIDNTLAKFSKQVAKELNDREKKPAHPFNFKKTHLDLQNQYLKLNATVRQKQRITNKKQLLDKIKNNDNELKRLAQDTEMTPDQKYEKLETLKQELEDMKKLIENNAVNPPVPPTPAEHH